MSIIEKEKRARREAFFILFAWDSSGQDIDEVTKMFLASEKARGIKGLIQKRIFNWKKNARHIDKIIEKNLKRGTLRDIASVARSALRLGICEIDFLPEIPPEASISEMVKITQTYGDPDLARFVNAILDAHYKNTKDNK